MHETNCHTCALSILIFFFYFFSHWHMFTAHNVGLHLSSQSLSSSLTIFKQLTSFPPFLFPLFSLPFPPPLPVFPSPKIHFCPPPWPSPFPFSFPVSFPSSFLYFTHIKYTISCYMWIYYIVKLYINLGTTN